MEGKVIWVFTEKDKSILEHNGFLLLKHDTENNVYIFAFDGNHNEQFSLDTVDHYISNTLTF